MTAQLTLITGAGVGKVFPLDRDGVDVGEMMEGPGMPIAWPREPGDIPPVPEVIGERTGPQFRVDE